MRSARRRISDAGREALHATASTLTFVIVSSSCFIVEVAAMQQVVSANKIKAGD